MKSTGRKLALFAVLVACATACGGGSPSVDTSSPAGIAGALSKGGFDCSGYTANADAVGPKASGSCRHGSDDIVISTFTSASQRDALLKAVGATNDGTSVYGDAYVVTTPSSEDAKAIAKILGGQAK